MQKDNYKENETQINSNIEFTHSRFPGEFYISQLPLDFLPFVPRENF